MITTINEFKDQLSGGLADNLNISDIAKKHKVSDSEINKQLELGIKIELEHTKDKQLAREIALDHLAEMPDYYTKLNTIEEGKMITNINEFKKILESFEGESIERLIDEEPILLDADIVSQNFIVNGMRVTSFDETGVEVDDQNYLSWDIIKSEDPDTWQDIYDWLENESIRIVKALDRSSDYGTYGETYDEKKINENAQYESLSDNEINGLRTFLLKMGVNQNEITSLKVGFKVPTRWSAISLCRSWLSTDNTPHIFSLAFTDIYMQVWIGKTNENKLFLKIESSINTINNDYQKYNYNYIFDDESCTTYKIQ